MAFQYRIAMTAGFLLSLQACNILPGGLNSGGVCTKSDGSTVTTYSPFGTWKKVSGYTPARSETELENNYDVLAVLRNGETCQIEFVNGADTGTVLSYYGYTLHVDTKVIDLSLVGGGGEDSRSVNYSFKGSCGDTQMTWSDTSLTEVFKYRTKSTEGVSCSSSQ